MGSLCSKSSAHSGGHTVLGSAQNSGDSRPNPTTSRPDPRAAAAEAAERRLKQEQTRGTNSTNPNQGRLAAQVAKQSSRVTPESRQEERLVVCLLG
ncbi:hypothetical protein BDQ17DRAFT_1229446 [Cyathus striatus]|nr:hypothetical protein BDQ17DRAFT_1267205 [Cyathus striatus]KAF9015178.1 hypothetical protein BDQ17DRAFT_1229446 [Cyathus striatus]